MLIGNIYNSHLVRRVLAALVLSATALSAAAQLSMGTATLFNDDWRFSLDHATEAVTALDDSQWRRLALPHDWSIEAQPSPTLNACTGYFPGGIAWYTKHFTINDALPVHYIYFEGVYNRSEVYLNGHLLGKRPNGYVSFYYDMTPYLVEGENVLAVRVDHSREADSRWYTGSGIYRDVYIVGAAATHFEPWGLGWSASDISARRATVNVSLSATAPDAAAKMTAAVTLCDAAGKVVATGKTHLTAGKAATVRLTVKNPQLWDLDTPYLYTLTASLQSAGTEVDKTQTRVGLRSLRFDANTGFELNGRNIKVKGVCLHHDAGVLGSVVPPEVYRRRLVALKAIGVNAIRMSHNPQAPYVYDLCDELGLLVMDEASDEWEFPKRKWVKGWNVGTPKFEGTYDFFEEWIDRDVADMVRRDRNHPSVAFWSIGNEVDYPNDPYSHPILDSISINQPNFGGYDPKAPNAERIGVIANRLAPIVRAIDSSRPVTGALAGVVMSNQTTYPQAVDIVGYNYTEDRYAIDHATYPDRVIYGSENTHDYRAWRAVTDNDYIFGQFIWTGTEYLGEAGVWPSRGLGTGMLDFAGYLKPRGKFRAALWSASPVAYLGTYLMPADGRDPGLSIDADALWNYDEGSHVRVVCYTNAATARLLLDGKEIGAAKPYDDASGIIAWDVDYRPGVLSVEACDGSGAVVATDTIATSGRPYALRVSSDVTTLAPGATAHVFIDVVDDAGRLVTLGDNDISCHTTGAVRLLGLENGSNHDMSDHTDSHQRAYKGRLVAYIKADKDAAAGSQATITLNAPLLMGADIKLTIRP